MRRNAKKTAGRQQIMSESKLTERAMRLDDAGAYADTMNAIAEHIGIGDRIQADSALLEWQTPGFELGKCSIGIFAEDSLLAGYGLLWATGDLPVRPGLHWAVHPRYRDCGLEERLLRWGLEQGRAVMTRCPAEARVSLRSGSVEEDAFAIAALEGAGFVKTRTYCDMKIALDERPAAPPLPAGFRASRYDHERDLPQLVHVVRDAFSDHFGHIDEPFEQDLEQFRHWLDNDPRFDPALVIFPLDESTGEVAGCLLGLQEDYRDPTAGYVDIVGVRREYRRRGLATAMLRQSFAMFWDRDKRKAHLEVDGESLTNAVALYERAGMRVYRRFAQYEKTLREGVELAKVSMDGTD